MDKEKVIKGVHDARRYLEDREWVDKSVGVYIDALNDALALLKEQKAVKPYVTGRGESFETAETWWYACGNCNEQLDPNDKYCRHCGRKVKWE